MNRNPYKRSTEHKAPLDEFMNNLRKGGAVLLNPTSAGPLTTP
ncbi:hypothetical protein SAMN00790413_04980 [Deinococcus hopiensis KR-140]|uniref:Uncharacterized protein n=1 Tax=Deinococcus hopiensis KR-140 TaxID=695939 RepID=A0A1W1USS5_9DEIO|nr:hypothetical protein SAMN00790413_04980 [Deinococcus hopiensis KR-140]